MEFKKVFGEITPPAEFGGLRGAGGINTVLYNSITVIFSVAAVAFVIMFLISATQMVMSGGDKETIAKARSRITWAIIGVVLLALSFVIFRVLGQITGFNFILNDTQPGSGPS